MQERPDQTLSSIYKKNTPTAPIIHGQVLASMNPFNNKTKYKLFCHTILYSREQSAFNCRCQKEREHIFKYLSNTKHKLYAPIRILLFMGDHAVSTD